MKCPVCKERITLTDHGKEAELGNVVRVVCPRCGASFEFQAIKKLPRGILALLLGLTPIYVISSPYSEIWAVLILGVFLFWMFRWENVRPKEAGEQ